MERGRLKKFFIFSLFLALTSTGGYFLYQQRPAGLSAGLASGNGRLEAVEVDIATKIAGRLAELGPHEGDTVEAGAVVARLDADDLRAQLRAAESQVVQARRAVEESQAGVRKSRTDVSLAGKTLKRSESLVEKGFISKSRLDTDQTGMEGAMAGMDQAQSRVAEAEAALAAAVAKMDSLQATLNDTSLKAPISGRIGRALVTEGALVGQGEATPMAVIQQLDPIYADFRQTAALATRLRSQQQGEQSQKSAPVTLVADGLDDKRQGRMLFSDVTVDRGTGQLALRGEFPNKDGLLLPGMYVRVTLGLGEDPAAILVPQRAVQRGADGLAHVLVLDENDIVQSQKVSTGAMYGSDWHITEGLKENARVLVGGLAAAVPGTKVQIRAAAANVADVVKDAEVTEKK